MANLYMIYDLIIIGAGPVGLYSTFLAGYMKLNTLCIEIDSEIGGQPAKIYPKKEIYDFPGFNKITGEELIAKLYSQIKDFSDFTSIKTNVDLLEYKVEDEIIILKDANNHEYRTKYVLFTNNLGGYFPKKLHLDISKCNADIDYYLAEQHKYENKNIVVLGGGDSAVDYAIYISKYFNPENVYLIHRNTELSTKTKSIQQIQDAGVNVILNQTLVELVENKIIIQNNETHEHQTLDNIDNVLVQYGVEFKQTPVNSWTGFEKINNKFVVNNYYQTSLEKFFAAGNCTYNPDKINMIVSGVAEATIAINKIKALLPDTKKVVW